MRHLSRCLAVFLPALPLVLAIGCASASSSGEDDPAAGLEEGAGGEAGEGEGGAGGEAGSGQSGTSGTAGKAGSGAKAGSGGSSGTGGSTAGSGGSSGKGGSAGSGAKAGSGGTGGTGGSSAGSGGTGGAPAMCGDKVKQPTEQCDGQDFGGETCATLLGDKQLTGTLVCTGGCQVDTKGCVKAPKCGDGVINGTEQCDSNDFAGKSCADVLGDKAATGSLLCSASCTIDSSKCQKGPFCGNGKKDGTEECDGNDIGTASCDAGTTGQVSCTADCKLDKSQCVANATCGDGKKNGDKEQCDGADLDGATCKSVLANASATGTLACSGSCQFDTSGCSVPPACGDGKKNQASEECDGQDFGGETCASKLGMGHAGNLLCSADCKLSAATCTVVPYCGDGMINGSDQCDGATLPADATCDKIVGFMSTGTVTCGPACTFDTSGCSKPVTCGNGKLDAGEDCDGANVNGKTCADVLNNTHGVGTLACSANCTFDQSGCSIGPYCGDGKLGPGEECDDGNNTDGDGCSKSCVVQCFSGEYKFGTHCYVDVIDVYGSWSAAQSYCAQDPTGHLATISSKAENDFVWQTVLDNSAFPDTSPRWIGFTDAAVEATFVWVNGEATTYTNWNTGEPNNSGGNEDCAEMRWKYGNWNDNTCSTAKAFVCEYEPKVLYP